jgi:hypothetical protein
MTISNELFFAILSMDSYDRSSIDERLDVGTGGVGNAMLTINSARRAE